MWNYHFKQSAKLFPSIIWFSPHSRPVAGRAQTHQILCVGLCCSIDDDAGDQRAEVPWFAYGEAWVCPCGLLECIGSLDSWGRGHSTVSECPPCAGTIARRWRVRWPSEVM